MLVLNPYPQTPFPGKGVILLGLPPLVQARMLAVSHTKPLHDAVAQMADDLYGGYAPATPFLSTIEVFRQSEMAGFYPSFLLCKGKLILYCDCARSRVRYSVRYRFCFWFDGNDLCFYCDSRLPIVLFAG